LRHHRRMRNVNCYEFLNSFRLRTCQMPAYRPAPVMTDDDCTVLIEMMDNFHHITLKFIDVVFTHTLRLITFVIAALVRHHHSVSFISKYINLILPAIPELWESVQKNDQFPAFTACHFDMKIESVHFYILRFVFA